MAIRGTDEAIRSCVFLPCRSVMLVCKRIRHVAQRSFLALDLRAVRG